MTARKSARFGPAYGFALRAPPTAGPKRKNRTDHVLHKPDIFTRSQHAAVGSGSVQGGRVQADDGLADQVPGGGAQDGMDPSGRDFGQRAHDEATQVSARVRQGQVIVGQLGSPMGDQVEVKGARAIRRDAPASKGGFQIPQRGQDLSRRPPRLDKDDAVEIVRVGHIRPGRRSPPSRHPCDRKADGGQRRRRGFQQGPD